jgi:hypothetical protein
MKRLAIIAVALLLPFSAMGYGYPASLETGTGLFGTDAVTASVGGAGAVDAGGSAVLLNPSCLALLGSARIQAGVGPVLSKETVETPYGKFNISTIALGSTGFSLALPAGRGLGIGAGIIRLSDFSYKGEFYDYGIQGTDTVTVFEQQNNSGSVWEASAGIGIRLVDGISAGVSGGYRFGSGTRDYFHDTSVDTAYTIIETWEESAFAYRAGLTGSFSRVRIGAAYTSGMDMYPSRVSAGAMLGDMSAWEPALGADLEIKFPGDSTQFTARVFGGALISGNSLYGRAALMLFSGSGSDAGEGTGLSMGMSVKMNDHINLDAALSWTNQNRNGDAFGGYADNASVTDTNTGITAGITWKP